MSARALLPMLMLPLALAGCVTGSYQQVSYNEPIDPERLQALEPGRDDLTTCLAALGAPVTVREYKVGPDRRSGMALAWFWNSSHGWGLRVSVSVYRGQSLSFNYDSDGTDLPGCVLWFDEDLVLERYEQGLVGQLLPRRRRASPAVDG